MASVTFSQLWLHNLSDYSDNLAVDMSDVKRSNTAEAQTLKMVNGRLVSIRRPGLLAEFAVTLRFVSRTDLAWIESRSGQVVLVRTPHGEKVFARIDDLTVSETLLPGVVHSTDVGTVSFKLTEVTYTEAV